MLRSLLAAMMTCALTFTFVGCAEEPAPEPEKPAAVDTAKAADTAKEVKKDVEKKAEEAKDAVKKAVEKK